MNAKAYGPILRLKAPQRERLGRVGLVALQHLLPSIIPLVQRLIDDGMDAQTIFLLGKPYSTVPEVAEQLSRMGCRVHVPGARSFNAGGYAARFRGLVEEFWRIAAMELPSDLDRLIVLDEGGWLSVDGPGRFDGRIPVVAIEHTMQGLFTTPAGARSFPVVLMAASAAKTRFESAFIADALVSRLADAVPGLAELTIGVLGLGNIGMAVARSLHHHGVRAVHGFDIVDSRAGSDVPVVRAGSAAELIGRCEVILGCTGRDTLEPGAALHGTAGRRWLASCSSGDVEFLRVARLLARKHPTLRADPFRDGRGMVGDCDVTLLNGGFPLNFDRVKEHERPSCIRLTRELTYASVLQAALSVEASDAPDEVMLDAEVQRQLVEAWLGEPETRALFPKWEPHGVEWWIKHSRGTPDGTGAAALFEVCL